MKKIGLVIISLIIMTALAGRVKAQENGQTIKEENFEAKIVKIVEDREIEILGAKQAYQKLELTVLDGENKGKIITVENGNLALANVVRYKQNEKVVITVSRDQEGRITYVISDSVRRDSLILLFVIFLVVTIGVSRMKGVLAIMSMMASFGVIYYYIIPQISAGSDPVLTAMAGSMVIIPVTFYMSHGVSRKTSVAVIGTLAALIVTGLLARIFIEITYLYGLSSEEAGFLAASRSGGINMKGILLAGIVIGALGVLDDITVSQAAIVEQLRGVSEKLKTGELFGRAMKVGQDHITSMVNTLILVYAGASLPLLLIFKDNPQPFGRIINHEFLAEEIVRTLVGSIGLITAVPITTLIASLVFKGTGHQRPKPFGKRQ